MKTRLPNSQSGAALMGIVLVIFISASTLLYSAVRPPSSLDAFDKNTYRELKAAKASLIAFATNYASYNNDDLGPGRLPCPAPWTESVDGEEHWTPYWGGCNWKYVLRLPEFAILPDGSKFRLNDYYADRGLQFWYAISRPYRWYRGSYPVLNTSTGAELSIDGDSYVAVLIAPGAALENQDRDATENFSNYYGATEYLEGNNDIWGGGSFQTYDEDDPENFNDLVIGITHSELMTPITAIVIGEIKTLLDSYHPANGDSFPLDVDFDTAMATAPDWYFNDEWDADVSYEYVDEDTANVSFSGCNGSFFYTLRFQDPDPDADQVVPVSRSSNAC